MKIEIEIEIESEIYGEVRLMMLVAGRKAVAR